MRPHGRPVNRTDGRRTGTLVFHEKDRSVRRAHRPLIVLAVGAAIAAGSVVVVSRAITSQVEGRLEERADRVTGVLDLQLRQYESTSRAVAAVRRDAGTLDVYDRRIRELGLADRLPGAYALNSTTLVAPEDVAAYVAEQRVAVDPDFAIRPAPGSGSARLAVIDRVAPLEPNRSALGFDVLTNPDAAVAADRTLDTGESSLSDALTLVQEPGDQSGLVLYMPWFDDDGTVAGATSVVLRGQDFLEALKLGDVGVTVTDPSVATGGSRVIGRTLPSEPHPRGLSATRTVSLYGQTWQVEIAAAASFASGAERTGPAIIPLGILALALLGAGLVEALQRREEHAREQVHARTRELVAVNGRLHDALAAKDEFLAVLGHEFRTPLTVIRGFAATLQAGRVGPVSPDVASMLSRIDQQAARLDGLVDDLLIAARLQKQRVRTRPELVDVASLLHASAAEQGGRVGEIIVDADEGLVVEADRTHCSRVLSALLSNCAKYGEAPVFITARGEDEYVVITVRDSGPGIPDDARDGVFKPFAQADSGSTRRSQGVGLGLAIVRELCAQNGGSVELADDDGPGACFIMRIPRIRAPDSASVQSGSSTAADLS